MNDDDDDAGGGGAPALRAGRLGRRYGQVWGLRDCTLEVPAGVIAGLVGPNGAGKTTLLEMIIGLLEPTEGQVSVFGVTSRARTAARLAQVGYVAQDHPLYRDFSVADMFHLGRAMNPSWDQQLAQSWSSASPVARGTANGTPPSWSAPTRPGPRRSSAPGGRPTRWASNR